ncbi:MAG TPA: cob(I)yrinic acid a,c-diamide adenosyltransferase [Thermoplasmataceae archaeon]|nr:cob(I)yrinic acid a,c-diamide adenosyltransferase [Thermoplasmatales archaeon AK]HLH86149.1 cob(I)yrinic acid a,c-diamide adenosyltransferase [Thermoplasmataceae archaeon]
MFTRRGDSGETDTAFGQRVSKGSTLIDIEGTVDELNSFIGFSASVSKWDDIRADLIASQRDIFTIGEHILADGKRRTISPDRTVWLEDRTKSYRSEVGKITLFVLPGGSIEASALHMARTVCRRLERMVVAHSQERKMPPEVLSYLNRLSSMLFMMALATNRRLGVSEDIWLLRESHD